MPSADVAVKELEVWEIQTVCPPWPMESQLLKWPICFSQVIQLFLRECFPKKHVRMCPINMYMPSEPDIGSHYTDSKTPADCAFQISYSCPS